MNEPKSERARTVAILFGRKGSRGFPGKNLYPILGRPASLYPLLAAAHAQTVDRIYVSTDDEAIVDLGREYGAEWIERPPELCDDAALVEDAMQHAFHAVSALLGYEPEHVVILLCNSCNILATAIDEGVARLDAEPEIDSVITASKLNMFAPLRARRLQPDGTLVPFVPLEAFGDPTGMTSNRSVTGDVYFADGGMTVVRGRFLRDISTNLLPFRWMGNRIAMIEQLGGGGDIDEGWQVAAMDWWLRQHGFSDSESPYPHDVRPVEA